MKKSNYRIIISGGGTGGHIFPAIAIANALLEQHPSTEVLFVGSSRGMEMTIVPSHGFQIKGVSIMGLKRSFSLSNLKLPAILIKGLFQSYKILKEFKPHIIIGVGGYAAFPIIKMGSWRSIPYLLQEQNSFAGVVNRVLASKAKEICVAYPNMERFFPKEKIIITGNPIRSNFRRVTAELKMEAKKELGFPVDRDLILIVGGSLGAYTINQAVMSWVKGRESCEASILWQFGKGYSSEAKLFLKESGRDYLTGVDFLSNINRAIEAADLVISRAGATTISELSIAGKATIFVPSPNVAENHQYHNANSLVERGAALLIEDKDAIEKMLPTAVELLKDRAAILQLEQKMASCAILDSSNRVANRVFELLSNSNG